MKVTLLVEEWTQSTKGGAISILQRELGINLAKRPDVKVSILIPNCSEEDKLDTKKYNIKVVKPEECLGRNPVDWLAFPPEGFSTDFVIGHDVKLGWQGQAIRRNLPGCKWIHLLHDNEEEMGLYKNVPDAISAAQNDHENQVKLCESADLVVTIGPKLRESFSSALSFTGKEAFNLTPGIFDEFCNLRQDLQERKVFNLLIFGRGDTEDFKLKGFDVAAKAVASLEDRTYRLIVVGAPDGRQEELAEKLQSHGISLSQLNVRRIHKDRDQLARYFCEGDLLIMPSGTEAFGVAALEALSAGLPILVTSNSGLAEALREVSLGSHCIVESEADWAKEIKKVRKYLKTRQEEAKLLREAYKGRYSWEKQCAALVENMMNMNPALELRIDAENIKPAEHIKRIPVSDGRHQDPSTVSGASGYAHPLSAGAEFLHAPNRIPTKEELFRLIVANYLQTTPPRCTAEHTSFLAYAERMRLVITGTRIGCLVITVRCDSVEVLEGLWKDYKSGRLGDVVQRCFATEEILTELNLAELKLKTTIFEEEYKACKVYFETKSARDTVDMPKKSLVKEGPAFPASKRREGNFLIYLLYMQPEEIVENHYKSFGKYWTYSKD